MSRAVGIDLGTTNSLVGYIARGREVLVTDPITSKEWMPSLVGRDPRVPYTGADTLRIGSDVEGLVKSGSVHGVHSVKRLMGRRWDDPQVQRLIEEQRLSYEITEDPKRAGEIAVRIGEQLFTPIEISSMILRRLKQNAEAQGLDAVSHAVITVPAYFRDPAIHATREAGRLAGLRVKHIMPEPTAAAVAYGANELDDGSGRYVLVFDFGGGTFDVSLMLAAAGTLNVLRVGGDNFLGGDDVDRAVMDRFDQQLRTGFGASLLEGRGLSNEDEKNLSVLRWKLKLAARQAKEAAAVMDSAQAIEPTFFRTSSGTLVNANWSLSRAELTDLARPFVDRAMEAVGATLEQASLTPADVNQVVIAGGSSRLPGVLDRLRAMFPDSEILNTVNPMTAIAIGAIRTARAPFPWSCPSCGRENELTAAACVGCSTAAPSEVHPCDACGALMAVAEQECPNPQCRTRVVFHAPPVEVLSHDIVIRVRSETESERWKVLVPRDTPIDPSQVRASEPSPWGAFETWRSGMDRIELPIAQDQDEDDEEPELIAAYVVKDLPSDLPEGESVEVRVRLDGDRVAEAEVRIRGRIHQTERIPAYEMTSAAAGEEDDEEEEETWDQQARWRVTYLRITSSATRSIPMQARHPANQALIAEIRETAKAAADLAERLEEALERQDRRTVDRLMTESDELLEEALPLAETIGLAGFLLSVVEDVDTRTDLKRALDAMTSALRDGGQDDPVEAWRALQLAIAATNMGSAGPDGPAGDRHLLRTAQWGKR